MKKYVAGLILGLSALTAIAQEAIVTETNPLKLEFLAKAKTQAAVFRPSPNLPEIVNEDLIRGMSESGETKTGKGSQFIGYMPKLKVLPCAKGCEGKDYDTAVAEFIKGYRGNKKLFEERGEMIVQVRWFNVRPFLMRSLPYTADVFGVSFMLEGKVISLGKSSGPGTSVTARDLANVLGGRLAMELAYTLGMGAKPSFLQRGIVSGEGFGGGVIAVGKTLDNLTGVEDVRPRIEPATEAHANLLPAVDGILPNEVEPITEMRYLNLMLL